MSKSQLTPPLRTPLKALRFSPDGRYILLQDEATIYVLTRDPLSVRFQVDASDAAPARFSPDSQKLVIPTYTMGVEWRSLPDGRVIQTTVLAPDGSCYEARLSPKADLYGCIDRSLTLRVFEIAKRQQMLAQKVGDVTASYLAPEYPEGPDAPPIWNPSFRFWPVLDTFLEFSPDERIVVASSFRGKNIVARFATGGQIALREPLSRALDNRRLEFIAPGRVLLQTDGEASPASVISFPDGTSEETLPLAGPAAVASDARYVLVSSPQPGRVAVIDLTADKEVQDFPVETADVLGDFIVGYDKTNDRVILAQIGSPSPTAQISLPIGHISHLTGAAVSGDLRSIAIGVRGEGGVFQTTEGKRVARLNNLEGAWFDGNDRCYARVSESDGTISLREINLMRGDVSVDSPGWFLAFDQKKMRLQFSGPIVVSATGPGWGTAIPLSELLLPRAVIGRPRVAVASTSFDLRGTPGMSGDSWRIAAFELNSGRELWSRKYEFGLSEWDVPYEGQGVPFDDPQGDRFVLGWIANTKHAQDAARKASASVQLQMKTAKLSEEDSFLEVIDAPKGETVGGVLVQHGIKLQFDGAFSAGDWLILEMGPARFSAYSLSSGLELLSSFGLCVALSGDNGLLALAEEHGLVSLYDLKTSKKVSEYRFPDDVVYMHFSADEKRLLAVTRTQSVYVLDVSGLASSARDKQ